MLKRHTSYMAEYKLQAVEKANVLRNRAAARESDIDEKNIRQWQRDK